MTEGLTSYDCYRSDGSVPQAVSDKICEGYAFGGKRFASMAEECGVVGTQGPYNIRIDDMSLSTGL
jgi:hypothetical protein